MGERKYVEIETNGVIDEHGVTTVVRGAVRVCCHCGRPWIEIRSERNGQRDTRGQENLSAWQGRQD